MARTPLWVRIAVTSVLAPLLALLLIGYLLAFDSVRVLTAYMPSVRASFLAGLVLGILAAARNIRARRYGMMDYVTPAAIAAFAYLAFHLAFYGWPGASLVVLMALIVLEASLLTGLFFWIAAIRTNPHLAIQPGEMAGGVGGYLLKGLLLPPLAALGPLLLMMLFFIGMRELLDTGSLQGFGGGLFGFGLAIPVALAVSYPALWAAALPAWPFIRKYGYTELHHMLIYAAVWGCYAVLLLERWGGSFFFFGIGLLPSSVYFGYTLLIAGLFWHYAIRNNPTLRQAA